MRKYYYKLKIYKIITKMKSVEMNDFERHMFQFLATICSQNREKGKVIEQGDSFGTNGRK
jgi:hypothetical protein